MKFLRQNTAVIIAVGPFYDRTDGVTIETGLTITNERITLTADTDDGSAPTNILDNVTGATSGTSNDLNYITGNDAGMMQIELSAENTNRVGRMLLSITDAGNHVPVFHELFVLPQAIFDWFTGVIVPLPANATHAAGTAWGSGAITAASIATGAITNAKFAAGAIDAAAVATGAIDADALAADAGTEIGTAVWATAARTLTAATNITSTGGTTVPQTGDAFARLGAPAGASVSADVAAVKAQTAAIEIDTQDLQTQVGTDGAGLTAIPGVTLADNAITAAKFDESTAFPLTSVDTGATRVARTGADADTLETISDQLDAAVLDGVLFLGDTQIA